MKSENNQYHIPVMLQECLEGLAIEPTGKYVDATFGGGGHSMEILKLLNGGRLFAFDQDSDALANANKIENSSFTFCYANFRYLKRFLRVNGSGQVDGILADLGISSHQIDTPERGFSTRFDGALDMRMDQNADLTAAKLLHTYTEDQLHKLFGIYGEVKNAKTLAATIIRERRKEPITTTMRLTSVLSTIAPRGKEFKYYAQVFQALRIGVNDEMAALKEFLEQCGEVIRPGGRLVIMSYHSLEDRLVKNLLKTGNVEGKLEKDFYGNIIRPFNPLTSKPAVASESEIAQNPRSRSAKLRIGIRNNG